MLGSFLAIMAYLTVGAIVARLSIIVAGLSPEQCSDGEFGTMIIIWPFMLLGMAVFIAANLIMKLIKILRRIIP